MINDNEDYTYILLIFNLLAQFIVNSYKLCKIMLDLNEFPIHISSGGDVSYHRERGGRDPEAVRPRQVQEPRVRLRGIRDAPGRSDGAKEVSAGEDAAVGPDDSCGLGRAGTGGGLGHHGQG